MVRCFLVLEDGSVMEGESFGSRSDVLGEVVFSTGMGGYQECLTDPASKGQILVMTYPLIGNYGVCDDFSQSDKIHASGLAVREYCKEPSGMYGGRTLDSLMKEHGVPGISGIDTRELVVKIREAGTLRGAIVPAGGSPEKIIRELRKKVPAVNHVAEVSSKRTVKLDRGKDITVGLIDCGVRKAVVDELASRFNVIVFPYDTPAKKIIDSGVNGAVVSTGPGDPSHAAIRKTVVRTVDDLSSKMPLLGICFGHQVIALALGGETSKMKFGHRGCSQPVRYDGRVYMTSQSHGFAVDEKSLDGTGLVANQFNINDGSVEGMRHRDLPIFTVQYHPEAAPGPCDTKFVFDRFGRMMEAVR
jgi:carbamoyl-phosphate synthase small subunit